MSHEFSTATRAASPVIGVALLVLLTAVGAAVVGAATIGQASVTDPASHASIGLTATADRIVLVHRSGDRLDVRDLRFEIRVDDEPLAHQPPVPFFSARGFRPGPTGPFNVADDPHWTAGETASLRVAGTNAPAIYPGTTVSVTIYEGERTLLALSTTVRG